METDAEFKEWLLTRPKVIQELGNKFPPGDYRIKEGAPYGYTCPGSIVSLIAYNESGQLRVRLYPENALPEGIAHAKSIRASFEADCSIDAYIEPEYLESLIKP